MLRGVLCELFERLPDVMVKTGEVIVNTTIAAGPSQLLEETI